MVDYLNNLINRTSDNRCCTECVCVCARACPCK